MCVEWFYLTLQDLKHHIQYTHSSYKRMREVCVRGHGVWYWPHTTSCYGPGVGRSDQITIRVVMGVWYMFGIDEDISPNSAILSFSLYLVIYAFAIQLLAVNLNLLKHFLNWIWQPVLTLVFKRSCPSLNRMSQNRLIFFVNTYI